MDAVHSINLASLTDPLDGLDAAFVLGALIGFRWQSRQRTAGARTNVPVAVGATERPFTSEGISDVQECQGTESGKDRGGNPVYKPDRQAVGHLVPEQHGGHIGQHHAQRGAGHHGGESTELRREGDSGYLCLIAHFGKKEGNHRGTENAEPHLFGPIGVDPVGNQRSGRHGDEGQTQHPTPRVSINESRDPGPRRGGKGMIGERRHQNAQNNGPGFAKPGSEKQRKELGLVADFGEGDDAR